MVRLVLWSNGWKTGGVGLRTEGYILTDEEAHQLLSEVDVDRSGFIDFDEFMATIVDWSEVKNLSFQLLFEDASTDREQ